MYLTQAQLEKRIHGQEIANKKEPRKQSVELNKDEKAFFAVLSEGDSAKNVAENFGLTTSTVKNAERGINTIKNGVDLELKEKVENLKEQTKATKETARELALNGLISSLGIVSTKLPQVKNAETASRVAKDMVDIVDKLDGGSKEGGGTRVNILIHGSAQKDESSYNVIEVSN